MSHKSSCSHPRPVSSDEGLVSIFTGDGKGKTTAAIGTAIRAAGHGFKVFIAFFAKGDRYSRGEAGFLSHIEGITIAGGQHPNWLHKDNVKEEDIEMAANIEERIQNLKNTITGYIDYVIDLIVVFILKTIIIPIVVLWILVRFFGKLIGIDLVDKLKPVMTRKSSLQKAS